MDIIVLNAPPCCVPKGTEFLTKTGWKNIEDFDNDVVAVCDKFGVMHWEIPEFVEGNTPTFEKGVFATWSMVLTPGHKVLYENKRGSRVVREWSEISLKSKWGYDGHIPATFYQEFGEEIDDFDLLRVAVLADSSEAKGRRRTLMFNIKKDRKKERLRDLLKKTGVAFSEKEFKSMPGYTRFFIHNSPFMKKDGIPDHWWTLSSESSEILLNEMLKWDGSEKYSSFSTTSKEEADLFQLLAAKSGRKAKIYIDNYTRKHDNNRTRSVAYQVRVLKSNSYSMRKGHGYGDSDKAFQPYKEELPGGKCYCFTTTTGFWVARQDGMVFLTGNSGKDYLADLLVGIMDQEGIPTAHREVKEMLFSIAIKAAGITPQLWAAIYDRHYKEEPCPYLMIDGKHVSPREFMIHCSEDLIKPVFGKHAFGDAAVNALRKDYPEGEGVVIYSDGGFIEEVERLSEYAYSTGGDFMLVRVHRKGYDWGIDSRSYLNLAKNGVRGYEIDIDNKEGCALECAETIAEVFLAAKEGTQFEE